VGEVAGLSVQHAAPGTTFTTYTFEVADFHTYFVGGDGVWVHNTGAGPNPVCEKALSIYKQFRGYGRTPEEAFAKANALISKYVTKGEITQDASIKHLGDTLDEVVKIARQEAGKPVPPGNIFTKGRFGDAGLNLWEGHWLKHKDEFPGIGPVGYADQGGKKRG
jgi:hypothetical protein